MLRVAAMEKDSSSVVLHFNILETILNHGEKQFYNNISGSIQAIH